MADGRKDTPGDVKATERLMHYWGDKGQPGYVKINWGVDGDFARCEAELGKYVSPAMVKGLCANLHHRATGAWPGHAPGESKPGGKR